MEDILEEYGIPGLAIVCLLATVKTLWSRISRSEEKLEGALEKSDGDVRECRQKHEATKSELSRLAIQVAKIEATTSAYERVEQSIDMLHKTMLSGLRRNNDDSKAD